ncbi:MAG: GntR family transcriptional regulator [Cellvibrio sp. 79]|nr:MAG: GntR family transcriptional regulator [Cellvibrio sp. 79]
MSPLIPFAPVPLYNQLKELLRAQILDGTYPAESRMPSESELGDQFQVSRITVRQALGDLQKEGLIFKIHGKGTFVAKPKAFQNVSTLQGLAESLAQLGHEVINQLLSVNFIAADARIAERLQLNEGDKVAEIKRVRLINREPVSLEISYVPPDIGEKLQKADLITRDIFLIIENDLQLNLGHADLAIDAVLADSELTKALNVEEGAPIMRIERLTHTATGKPIDFEFLYYRGDAFQYRFRIDRQRASSQKF